MTSFSAILDQPSTGVVERPKPMPVGTYLCIVQGLPRFDKTTKKQTEFVEFTLQPIQASEDVDQEALAEAGGLRPIRHTLYITEDAKYRIDEFLDHCGLLVKGKSRAQMIDETPNCQLLVSITHEFSLDGTTVYARVARTAPVIE
jgi:hypothetical protein